MSDAKKTIADIASEMARRQATSLDEGCATLLRSGVHVHDLEIVHETYSRSNEPFVIHQRTYVRAREEAWNERIRQEERERIAKLLDERAREIGPGQWGEQEDLEVQAAWLRAGAKTPAP